MELYSYTSAKCCAERYQRPAGPAITSPARVGPQL